MKKMFLASLSLMTKQNKILQRQEVPTNILMIQIIVRSMHREVLCVPYFLKLTFFQFSAARILKKEVLERRPVA